MTARDCHDDGLWIASAGNMWRGKAQERQSENVKVRFTALALYGLSRSVAETFDVLFILGAALPALILECPAQLG